MSYRLCPPFLKAGQISIVRNSLATFLSGRIVSLVLLLGFQMAVVRLLAPREYGVFALVLALATLFQTVVSFGVPRLIPRYVSLAGTGLSGRTVERLVLAMTGFRVLATGLILGAIAGAASWLGWNPPVTQGAMLGGIAYILVSIVQVDTDAMTQALGQQRLSRLCLVGEAVVRLVLLLALAAAGHARSAADVVLLSTATAAGASVVALMGIVRSLRRLPVPVEARALDRSEFRTLALGGWASAIAWFASSPAVVRLVAGRLLGVVGFAGFAFVQGLVVSFQRYTPGMMLFPFVEADVMRHFARTGDRSRLQAALSLVVKIDILVIGGAILGTMISGRAIVELLTGGRYGEMGAAMPWLLAYILTTSLYRAFEIVAVLLGETGVLFRMLAVSVLWLAVMLACGRGMGVTALLLFPICDALCRLALMNLALRRAGMRHVVDLRFVAQWAVLLALLGAGASWLGADVTGGASILLGTGAGVAYLLLMAFSAPFRRSEMDILVRGRSSRWALRLSRAD